MNFNIVKASQIPGVVLDCDLATGNKIGGGSATDNTALLNQLLATASETNPIKLIIDGGSLITGLHIAAAGYTCIEGIGRSSGFFVKSGSNSTAIDNGVPPASLPSTLGANVILRDFQVNGNRGNGTTGNTTSGDPRWSNASGNPWLFNIDLWNINGVLFDNLYVFDAPTYGARLSSCNDVTVENCNFTNPNVTTSLNNDCLHFDGPGGSLRVANNYFNNNYSDDGVAINAPEGYSNGVLDQVIITGNNFEACLHAARIYGSVDMEVGVVNFSDNTGVTSENVVLLGLYNGTASGDVNGRSIIVKGNQFNAGKRFLEIDSGSGDVVLVDNTWYQVGNVAAGFIYFQGSACHISSLHTRNNRVYREYGSGSPAPPLLYSWFCNVTIDRMVIDGYYLLNKQGTTGNTTCPAALRMASITIADLYVASLEYANITALADSYATIANLHGPAVQTSTTITVDTTTITANSCSAEVDVTIPGITTAMTVQFTPTADLSSVAGWSPGTGGQLYFTAWVKAANTLAYRVCNATGTDITPGASTTWNVSFK